MNLRSTLLNLNSRFNAMSLRERGMVAVGALAVLVLAWDQLLMDPLRAEKMRLSSELDDTQKALAALSASISGRANDNPMVAALEQKRSLNDSLAAVDAELESASAGLIAPPRMLDALRDVLARQQGLRLVSMRNLPVRGLVQAESSAAMQGPYVHALEMVVEGSYMDVLRYLESVEALPWRFYWQALELRTTDYPTNRVRIRLNTLSMDKEWLGVGA